MLKTCRTCLIGIQDTTYIKLNDNDVKPRSVRAELLACIPELQLDLVQDPVICSNCVNTLQSAYRFKTQCLLIEKSIQSCLRSAKLNGKSVTLTKLFRFCREIHREKNCSSVNGSATSDSNDRSRDPTPGEHFPAQLDRASLDIEANNDELERTDDCITFTENEDFNVIMNSDVSMVVGEDENDFHKVITNDGAIMESLLQPPEFQDKILGWPSAATCTDVYEMSQDFDNTMDVAIVKQEHELLTFKREADETSSLKNENVNDDERSYYYKTGNLSEVSNLKERPRSVTCDVDRNCLVDEEYGFSVDIEANNDKHERSNDYITSIANQDFVDVNSDVSTLDGEGANALPNFVTNGGAIVELTSQPLEIKENRSGSLSTSTEIKGEISQDFHNAINDDIVKVEHELLTFKTETDEALSFKEGNSNNIKEERSDGCKIGYHIKEETRSITDNADGNDFVDNEEYGFPAATRAGEYFDTTESSVANITEQYISSVKKRRVNYAYSISRDEISQQMDEDSLTNEEHELGTFKPKQTLNEQTFNGCTANIGFANKECSVNLQKLHFGDLTTKSSFNANELLNITSAKSLQATNKKPERVRHNGSKNLSKHEQARSTIKSFCCKVCTYSTTFRESLVSHMRTHTSEKPFQCKVCEYRSLRKHNLIKHMRTHTGEKPFRCRVCDFSTAYKNNLTVHLRIHADEKPFKCNVCEYSTIHKQSLIMHIRTHAALKPFQCNICEYSAVRKTHLTEHMRTHTGEKPFKCNVCEYSAGRKHHLIKHMRTHTGEKPFQCNVCDYRAVHKQNLIGHMRTHTGEKPFQCNVCEYSAVQKDHLTSHMQTHTGEKTFQCNVCDYRAVHKQNLIRHMQTHTGEKPFQCNVCEYSAGRKHHLIKHMRTHTGEKPFQCDVCDYRAVHKQNLIGHMRTHTGEKPFQCNVCEYSTLRKGHLTSHMQTHTGEKPFQCNVCDYRAVHKQNLTRHMQTHAGNKLFRCNVCNLRLTRKGNLDKHIRTHMRKVETCSEIIFN